MDSFQRLHASSVPTTEGVAAMIRAGLTGGLASGKSTVSAIFRALGAHVLEADAIGRQLMEPGQHVYDAIVAAFGPEIVQADGSLNRRRLAEIAFGQNRILELNRIVHPAVVEMQRLWVEELAAREAEAVAIVESALIFEADQQGTVPGWRQRFDHLILVTAPVEMRIERYVERMRPGSKVTIAELEADARARLAAQIPDGEKIPLVDDVIYNDGSLDATREQAGRIYAKLAEEARRNLPLQRGSDGSDIFRRG